MYPGPVQVRHPWILQRKWSETSIWVWIPHDAGKPEQWLLGRTWCHEYQTNLLKDIWINVGGWCSSSFASFGWSQVCALKPSSKFPNLPKFLQCFPRQHVKNWRRILQWNARLHSNLWSDSFDKLLILGSNISSKHCDLGRYSSLPGLSIPHRSEENGGLVSKQGWASPSTLRQLPELPLSHVERRGNQRFLQRICSSHAGNRNMPYCGPLYGRSDATEE